MVDKSPVGILYDHNFFMVSNLKMLTLKITATVLYTYKIIYVTALLHNNTFLSAKACILQPFCMHASHPELKNAVLIKQFTFH